MGAVTLALLVSALPVSGAGTLRVKDLPDTGQTSAGPPVSDITHIPSEEPVLLFTGMIRTRAQDATDSEVVAAAEFNLVHLRAVAADEAVARAALQALATSGDVFTLTWLQGPHRGPVATALEPVAVRTAERIRARLDASPEVPQKTARAWLLRTAVADLTCSALEVPLKRFEHAWLKRHAADPAVRRELEALAAAGQHTGHALDPGAIRARAGARAARVLSTRPEAVPADAAPSKP